VLNKLITGVILMNLVSGCSVNVDKYDPETLEYHLYGEEYSVVYLSIKKNDKVYSYAKSLLAKNRKGWRPSLISYAPNVRIRAENNMYALNICPDRLVVNYLKSPESKRAVQLVKKVSSETYNEIVVLVEEALRGAEDSGGSEESNP